MDKIFCFICFWSLYRWGPVDIFTAFSQELKGELIYNLHQNLRKKRIEVSSNEDQCLHSRVRQKYQHNHNIFTIISNLLFSFEQVSLTRRNATIQWKLKGAIQSPFSHHSVNWMAGTFQWPFSDHSVPFSHHSVAFQ